MKVLVVDDSKAMRMIVTRTLRQTDLDITEVREAEDGADALSVLESFDADLVLSDWNMPNKNGMEMLCELRDRGDRRTVGLITSESSPTMVDAALDAGASFVLAKPFTAERFAEALSVLSR